MDVIHLFERIFGTVVVKSFFGEIELDKIEGVDVFSYFSHMVELNTERAFTLFAFILGPNFFKYNIRKVDRDVNSSNIKFR
jgi:hypothetical protein